jgi:hypothetical protein
MLGAQAYDEVARRITNAKPALPPKRCSMADKRTLDRQGRSLGGYM